MKMGLQWSLNYMNKLDCDLLLGILHFDHKFLGMDRHISDLYKLCLMHTLYWQHILDGNPEVNWYIKANMSI